MSNNSLLTQDTQYNIKKVTYYKIVKFIQSKTSFNKFARIIALVLLLFRALSSILFKTILTSLLFILLVINIIFNTINIFVIIIYLCIVIFLFIDYITINIASIINPHIEALLRGLKLSTKLGSCGFPVYIYRNVTIRDPQKVFLGDNVAIYENAILIPGHGYIAIGDNSHIDSLTVIHGSGGVKIGDKVAIASGVIIYSQTNQYKEGSKPIVDQPIIYGKVIIEDDVWIGAGAIILPNVKIRKGAIIGAGAVVPMNNELKEYTIYVGVPAKPLKKRMN